MGKRTRSKSGDEEDEPITVDDPSDEVEARGEPATEEMPFGGDLGAEPGLGDPGTEDGRRSRVMRFAKRLMDRRELSNDTREILGSVLATSDKAKTEAVKLVAREVRSYLDALELKEDIKQLITSYSLEISISLKPLADVAAAVAPGEDDEDEALDPA